MNSSKLNVFVVKYEPWLIKKAKINALLHVYENILETELKLASCIHPNVFAVPQEPTYSLPTQGMVWYGFL